MKAIMTTVLIPLFSLSAIAEKKVRSASGRYITQTTAGAEAYKYA